MKLAAQSLALVLIISFQGTRTHSQDLLERQVENITAYLQHWDGQSVHVTRYFDGSATAEFHAEIKKLGESWLAEYEYEGQPKSIEVTRPDAYFRLTWADETWLPASASRSGPLYLTSLPEVYAPVGIDGVPLATKEELPVRIVANDGQVLEWVSRSTPDRHGKIIFGANGFAKESKSERDGVGHVIRTFLYDEQSGRLLQVLEKGSGGESSRTEFTWSDDVRSDVQITPAIFRLDHYGLSEDLLGPNSREASWWISPNHAFVLVGGIAILLAICLGFREKLRRGIE